MRIKEDVIQRYPETIIGLMTITGLDSITDRKKWNALKEKETHAFRSAWANYSRKEAILRSPLSSYFGYYKQFKKTYPVLLQMESTLLKSRSIQSDSLAVETMFMAEVKHGLLAGGHTLEKLSGNRALNLSRGGECFTAVTGQQRTLKADDLFITSGYRLLSSVLEGQDYYTRLTEHSAGALYCVYGVGGVTETQINNFFKDLSYYILTAFPLSSVQEYQTFKA